jgi:methyl-accepting chemotaxis protein-2 (aspartate sensor receptor)
VNGDFRSNRLLILITLFSVAVGSLMGGLSCARLPVRWARRSILPSPLLMAISPAASRHTVKTKPVSCCTALMEMKNRLLEIVQQVQFGSENISTAAAQIVAGNQDLAARTEEQASSVEQTAASMEQITATVKNTASHTGEATSLSADAPKWLKITAR